MMVIVYLILLIIHIICCLITLFGINTGMLNIHKYMFFVVLFLPFWGFAIVMMLHFQVGLELDGKREIGVEKMKLDSEILKSITVEEKNNTDSVIPIEEALVINSAKERRELIMDVLNDNPMHYIEFLQKAGNNDDTEVVHYAVTAMVEISKENDFRLQQLEREYAANPNDFEILTQYSDFLWGCLSQKLMQGQVEVMNRVLFSQLITEKLKVKEDLGDYVRLANNELKLKNYTQAGDAIQKMDELWPYNEEVIALKLQYYACLGRGKEISRLLDEIEQKRIYLSAKAKEMIAFWKN